MKTLTKSSHIGNVRQANQNQKQVVCQILGWTSEQYCQHQFYEYENFIKIACQGLPKAAEKLRYSPVFRGFYNMEWELRNTNDFLSFAIDLTTIICEVTTNGDLIHDDGLPYGDAYLISEYKLTHNAQRLFYCEYFAVKYANIINLILKKTKYENMQLQKLV